MSVVELCNFVHDCFMLSFFSIKQNIDSVVNTLYKMMDPKNKGESGPVSVIIKYTLSLCLCSGY